MNAITANNAEDVDVLQSVFIYTGQSWSAIPRDIIKYVLTYVSRGMYDMLVAELLRGFTHLSEG